MYTRELAIGVKIKYCRRPTDSVHIETLACTGPSCILRDGKLNRILANHVEMCNFAGEADTILVDRCSWLCDYFRDLLAHEDGTQAARHTFSEAHGWPNHSHTNVMGRSSSVSTLGSVSVTERAGVYQDNAFIRQYERKQRSWWHDNSISL